MKRKTALILFAIAVLTGCANMSKEQIGSSFGVIAGAVIGKQVGGDKGMVLGAALGGVLGNHIGAHLDEQDRLKLAEIEQRALETGAAGSFVTNKDQSTISVVSSASVLEKPQAFALSASLVPQALVITDPISLDAFVDTPIYNNTVESDAPKMVIQKGVPIRVAARVVDKDWSVVGDSNLGIGYVPARFLNPSIVGQVTPQKSVPAVHASTAKPAQKAVPLKAQPTKAAATNRPAGAAASGSAAPVAPVSKVRYDEEMAALYAAYKPRVAGQETAPAVQAAPSVQLIQASTECKVVSRTVDVPGAGGSVVEKVKYCKEPPKGWQTQAA